MRSATDNSPTVEYTLLEDNRENGKEAYSGDAPLLDAPFSLDDFGNSPTQPGSQRLQPSWLGWMEWFRGRLSWSRRTELQADDDELQAILLEGRKLRLEAEAISDQREGWYEFREQPGCRPGWKMVAGAALITAAAIFGYDRYRAGWWHTGNPEGELQGRDVDRSYPAPGGSPGAPPPEAAALRYFPGPFRAIKVPETIVEYEYSEVQPAQCKTKNILNRCKTVHSSTEKYLSRLILTIGQIPCLCPPPAVSNIKFEIIPPTVERVVLEYQYTENQPGICKAADFLRQCDNFFSRVSNLLGRVALKAIGGEPCLCPPPVPPFSVTFKVVPPIKNWSPPPTTPLTTASTTASTIASTTASTIASTGTSLTTPVIDDIKIKKMFDLSCIDERNSLSWIDVIRQIGITLQQPITALAQGSQIAHYHNQGKGCPPHEEGQRLKFITSLIDYILTSVLTLLPHSELLAWVQCFIGPALEMMADDLSGAEVDLSRRLGLDLQLLSMVRQTIPTLSQREVATLYNKPSKGKAPAPATIRFADRFTLHDDGLQVKIDGQKYQYQKSGVEIPYVIADEHAKTIRFNQKERRWEFVSQPDNLAYTADGRENRARFGIPLKQLFAKPEIKIQLDSTDERLLRITQANGDEFLGVAMGDAIIPVEKQEVSGETVITASSQKFKENRVLLHTNYGWVFESASVNMDKYLVLLLDSKDTGVNPTPEKKFSPIRPDGFSYNEAGEIFIKKDNKYYPVYKFMAGHAVSGHTPSLFTRVDGLFTLQVARDMLFRYKTVTIGYSLLEPEYSAVQLETEGWHYLMEHGVISNAVPKTRIRPGLYLDDQAQPIFSVSRNSFAVSSFQHSQINLKRKGDSYVKDQGDIQLWLDENLYLRIRDDIEKEPFSYSTFSSCRNKRAPEQGSCLPVWIEASLDALLTDHINLKATSSKNILNKSLTELNMFDTRVIFESPSNKYYFLYKGHYFNAELIDIGKKQNATDQIIVQLFRKHIFFGYKIPIASIVIENKGQKIEIKEQKTFIAEKLNINKAAADNYLQGRPYHQISGMDMVENAVEQVVKSGKIFIDEISENYLNEIPGATLNKIACDTLFPRRILENPSYSIKIFGLNDNSDTLLPYMRAAQKEIKEKLYYIKKFLLPSAINSIMGIKERFIMGEKIEYLPELINSDNLGLSIDFSFGLKKRLKKIAATLKMADINLVTAIHSVTVDGPTETILTESERLEGFVGFMTPDNNKKIFINIDKTYIPYSRIKGTADVTSLLIHEASHVGGMTADIVYFPKMQRDQQIYILDVIQNMIDKIKTEHVVDTKNFNQLTKKYLKNISIYRNKVDNIMRDGKLAYLVENDPGYRAHLILNSADLLSLIALDLHKINVFGSFSTKMESVIEYRQAKNVLTSDSTGTIYNLSNDYVIKDYSATVTDEHPSIANAAMKNAESMNRIYEDQLTTVLEHQAEDGTPIISVKMIKVPGTPLSSIFKISDQAQLEIYRTAVKKFITPEKNPAVELAEKLRIKGVNHRNINEDSLLFDIDKGFNLINFDSADIQPEGEALSSEVAADRSKELKQLIEKLERFLNSAPASN